MSIFRCGRPQCQVSLLGVVGGGMGGRISMCVCVCAIVLMCVSEECVCVCDECSNL